eukprot:GCRY01002502.1.p1 GENE.GCRY01002502.1~~GCRY01002502.1.p1  ORF type:complete len:184 (+),score=19.60 GCRY01002502.1:123-674(+)
MKLNCSNNKNEETLSAIKENHPDSAEKIEKLVNTIVNVIIEREKHSISMGEMENLWMSFLKQCYYWNLEETQILEDLQTIGLDEKLSAAAAKSIFERKWLVNQFFKQRVARISDNSLKNFDWQVNMVMGADTASNVKKPRCLLSFQFDDGKKCLVEFSQKELSDFVSKLDAVNTVLSQSVQSV